MHEKMCESLEDWESDYELINKRDFEGTFFIIVNKGDLDEK